MDNYDKARREEYERKKEEDRRYYQRQESKAINAKGTDKEEYYKNKASMYKKAYKSDYGESPNSGCKIS